MNMRKEKLDKEMTITKRLGRLEQYLEKNAGVDKRIEEMIKNAEFKLKRQIEDAMKKLSGEKGESKGNVFEMEEMGELLERLKILEKFFHGFEAVSNLEHMAEEGGGGEEVKEVEEVEESVPVPVSVPELEPEPAVSRSPTPLPEPEPGPESEPQSQSDFEPTATPTPAAKPPSPKPTPTPQAPPTSSQTNPNDAPTPLKQSTTPPKKSAPTIPSPTRPRSDSLSVNTTHHTGLVWKMTTGQKLIKNEIQKLRSEMNSLRQNLPDTDSAPKQEQEYFDSSWLESQIKALQENSMTLNDLNDLLVSSLPPPSSEVPSSEPLKSFNDRVTSSLSLLTSTKLDKSNFNSQLESYKTSIKSKVDSWNAKAKNEMFESLSGFKRDVDSCKSYIEKLEDSLKSLSSLSENQIGRNELEVRRKRGVERDELATR